ncbi:hypothetical protein LguiA_014627 [Lonicera macranthoides]
MAIKPRWLEGLLGEKFFEECGDHLNLRKNEKNIFCLLCFQSFCTHCLPSHQPSHPLLQPYTINSAKVIFLKQRAQSRSCKGTSSNTCFTCDRILQDPFHFCSLSCKVDHMVYEGEDLSSILHKFDKSDFPLSQFEGLPMDGHDSEILENDTQINPNSNSNSILEDPLQFVRSNQVMGNLGTSQRPELVKKNGNTLFPRIVLSLSNRRKGAPQRSPLS